MLFHLLTVFHPILAAASDVTTIGQKAGEAIALGVGAGGWRGWRGCRHRLRVRRRNPGQNPSAGVAPGH